MKIGASVATKANHHYVPQFYLRGFSDGVGRQARVFVFDSETKRGFSTLVRNVGSKRNFNRIDIDGVDINAVEDSLAEIESIIAQHLVEIIRTNSFPTQDHFISTIYLIGMLSVRNPRMRRNMENFDKRVKGSILGTTFSSDKIWQSQKKKMLEAGYSVNEDFTRKDMQKALKCGKIKIDIDQTNLIAKEFKMLNTVLNCLAQRNWCFVSSPEGSQYVTSDNPVVLTSVIENRDGFYRPGHGLAGTMILFPLCTNLLLIGTFEELSQEIEHSSLQVVSANTHIARYSTRQIYAKDGSFMLNLRDRENVRGDELTRYFR